MIVGLQSLTLQWISRVFCLNSPHNFMGNENFYSMGKEMRKALTYSCSCISQVRWRVDQVASHSWNASNTFHMRSSRSLSQVALVTSQSRNTLFFTTFHTEPITLNPTNIQVNNWKVTIKFDTEIKPIKKNWKSQLYRYFSHISSMIIDGDL